MWPASAGPVVEARLAGECRVFGGSRDASRYGGPSLDVGARIGPMDPGKYLSGMGPRPEEARATLGTLACRYDAVDEAQTYRSERLHRAASDRQAHNPRQVRTLLAGSAMLDWKISGASRGDCWAAPAIVGPGSVARSKKQAGGFEANGNGVAKIEEPPNNGVQLTRSARCAPFALRSWGQSLRAALAADPGCYPDPVNHFVGGLWNF